VVRGGHDDPFPKIVEDFSDWLVALILGGALWARRWPAGHEPLFGAEEGGKGGRGW